ncbi:MAG: NUDIX domain-containing protein [Bacteroidetes bacterium]|nr:NUDIX domain-containing protein [Bacteroidota bacterium]
MKQSAGILVYRIKNKSLEILLVHPGGPFWVKKDIGAWTIPKGEPGEAEDLLITAKREFVEETGKEITGSFIELKPIKQKSGKLIFAWAIESEFNVSELKSNMFEIEWPPGSAKKKSFPEIDKAEWFNKEKALIKINSGQQGLINELEEILKQNKTL